MASASKPLSREATVRAFGLVAVVQLILHYLGWIAIILGVVAFIAGNRGRAYDLLLGGAIFIVIKYVIGFIFVVIARPSRERDANDL
jgi:hypothetical protein